MKWPIERRIALGYVVVLLALGAMAFITFQNASTLVRNNQRLVLSHALASELDRTMALLSNAEAGQLGYVITGDERYLEPYSAALSIVYQQIARIRAATAHDPARQAQFATLEPLILARLDTLRNGVGVRRNIGFEAARQLILAGEGSTIMGEIRTAIGAMARDEAALIERQTAATAASARATAVTFALITAIAAASLVANYFFFERDIKARREAAAVVTAYSDEIRDLYDRAPCGYHSLDRRGIFVRINETELNWLGYTRDEVIGKLGFADVITPASRAIFSESFPRFQRDGFINELEFEMVRKDGSTFTVSLSATSIKDADGAYVRSRSTVHDITRRVEAERQERRTQALLKRMIEAMPLGVWLLDDQGNVTLDNPAGQQIWAGSNDLPGSHRGRRLHSGEAIEPTEWSGVRAITHGEAAINEEIEIDCFDGTRKAILSSAIPLRDDHQEIIGAVVVNMDITGRREAEAEIRRLNEDLQRRAAELASVNHELEAFSYSVSHDLRAPLRSIHGFSTALLEDYSPALDEEGREFLQRIRNATRRMAQLIDDLLSLSRVTRAELNRQSVDISEMARTVLDSPLASQR